MEVVRGMPPWVEQGRTTLEAHKRRERQGGQDHLRARRRRGLHRNTSETVPNTGVQADRLIEEDVLRIEQAFVNLGAKNLPRITGFPPDASSRLVASLEGTMELILQRAQGVRVTLASPVWILDGYADLRKTLIFVPQTIVCRP